MPCTLPSLRHLATIAAFTPVVALGAQQARGDGYIVGVPHTRLTVRTGADAPLARSDFWNLATDQLTLSRARLGAPNLSVEVAGTTARVLEVTFGAGISYRESGSTYRRFVDTERREIEQSTTLQRIPLLAGMRWNVLGLGDAAGTLAIIPRRFVPYVAAGGGFMHWRLAQRGDFVDAGNLDVFPGAFTANGWTPAGFVAAGADYAIGARTSLTLDARWTGARARLGPDFRGFGPLDLSSVAVTAGLTWRR